MSTWVIIAAPVLVFLLALTIWCVRIHKGSVFTWLFAPLTNDEHKMLSLARVILVAVWAAIVWRFCTHTKDVTQMAWPFAFLIAILTVICFSDILTTKNQQGLLMLLGSKLGVPGVALGAITEAAAAPNADPAAPAVVGPPDLNPTDQSG